MAGGFSSDTVMRDHATFDLRLQHETRGGILRQRWLFPKSFVWFLNDNATLLQTPGSDGVSLSLDEVSRRRHSDHDLTRFNSPD